MRDTIILGFFRYRPHKRITVPEIINPYILAREVVYSVKTKVPDAAIEYIILSNRFLRVWINVKHTLNPTNINVAKSLVLQNQLAGYRFARYFGSRGSSMNK
jgi:hypothetical protein